MFLVRSGTFAGWMCGGCEWRWPLHESADEADRRYALELMRHTFATHRCEDFPSRLPALPPPAPIPMWSPRRIPHLLRRGVRLTRIDRIPLLKLEEGMAATIAVASMLWTVQLVTSHFSGIAGVAPLPPEPVGICAIAVLVWLHAKWRGAMKDGLQLVSAETR